MRLREFCAGRGGSVSAEGQGRDDAPGWEEAGALLARLPQLPLDERIEAVDRLLRSPSPEIRDAALRVGAAVMDDERLVEALRTRSDAAALNTALEILKLRGDRALPVAKALLEDPNEQVVLQAIQLLDHLRDPRAIEPLRCMLRHEDPNVVQHGIVALGHIGDERVIPDLMAFLEADTWLQIGAVSALGDLRAREAVPALRALLDEPLVGPAAAEALARIGGAEAFRALAAVWLVPDVPLLDPQALELLAHVLEGLSHCEPDLRESIERFTDALAAEDGNAALPAARCVLALGPSPHDPAALAVLAGAKSVAPSGPERRFGHRDAALPASLAGRADLIPRLLSTPGVQRCWGFLLITRHREIDPADALVGIFAEPPELVCADCASRALQGLDDPRLAAPALDLYTRVPADARHRLRPILRRHAAALPGREAPDASARVLLAEIRGESPDAVAREIAALPPDERRPVVTELRDRPEILRLLPWQEWVTGDPQRFAPLAAEAALASELRELLPVLRSALARAPHGAVIKALGVLGDRDSVPELVAQLASAEPLARVHMLDALGHIGGEEARRALRAAARDGDREVGRVALRALSVCAAFEDLPLFREIARDSDWFLRLSAAETLRRLWCEENRAALELLAADPHALVARTARAALAGDEGA